MVDSLLSTDPVGVAYMSPVNQVRVISTVSYSVTVGAHSLLVSSGCGCCCCQTLLLEDDEPEVEDPQKPDHQPLVPDDDELVWPLVDGRQCRQLVSMGDVQ